MPGPGPRREPMELDDDLPDLPPLELASARPRAAAGPPASASPMPQGAAQASDSHVDDDLDDGVEGLPSLELANLTSAPASSRGAAAPSSSPGGTPAPPSGQPGTPRPAPAARPTPAPAVSVRPAVFVDPIDVVAFANYGAAPRAWFEAPIYAVRVMQRQRDLGRELARQRKLASDADDAVVERMARAAEALRGRIDPEHPAIGLYGQLGKYDELTQSRSVALHETSRQYAEQLAQVDERMSAEEEQRSKLARLVEDAALELGRLSAERARNEAKSKRIEIELRSAHDAARLAAGPDAKFAPPEHAHRIAALESDKAARAAELVPIMEAWTDAAEVARRRQSDEREARKKVTALRDERKRIEQTAEHQLEVRSEGARQAERDRFAAYAEVARAVLAKRPDDLTEAERGDIAAAEKRLAAAERDLELHVRAFEAADQPALRKGLALMLGGVVLVLVLFVAAIVRSGPADSPSPRSAPPATSR